MTSISVRKKYSGEPFSSRRRSLWRRTRHAVLFLSLRFRAAPTQDCATRPSSPTPSLSYPQRRRDRPPGESMRCWALTGSARTQTIFCRRTTPSALMPSGTAPTACGSSGKLPTAITCTRAASVCRRPAARLSLVASSCRPASQRPMSILVGRRFITTSSWPNCRSPARPMSHSIYRSS